MKVESNIRVGQLVRIRRSRDRGIYLVVTVHGQKNIEILSVDGNNKQPRRRWWVAEGLSVYA